MHDVTHFVSPNFCLENSNVATGIAQNLASTSGNPHVDHSSVNPNVVSTSRNLNLASTSGDPTAGTVVELPPSTCLVGRLAELRKTYFIPDSIKLRVPNVGKYLEDPLSGLR